MAETIIAPTAGPAVETGKPGERVGVAGIGVSVEVGVEVGQGVMVGCLVGVEVGRVAVAVNAARMIIF